ncbi:uncharacterized protein LOC134837368 [Culicoides brevitarsis]|uniref:uncharacterized protein LOC134837368 n=1 Tax=Culicoides brevitarsis TaxID=469753 RepID=UPI00307BB982
MSQTMKILIPLLAIIVAISAAKVPQDSDYDTKHLKIVKKCEDWYKVDDTEKAIWWSWKIPVQHKHCYMQCVMTYFRWINRSGGFNLNAIKRSYEAVGHGSSAPDKKFLDQKCGKLHRIKDPCSKSILLYACLLVKSPNLQHFKDAFDGKRNTV